jgi:PhzF family phenazine biosynthesis protein
MKLPIYQVDAFASATFAGNPAAVCPLEAPLEPRLMQAIAAENNVSETAFIVRRGTEYDIRWFTPKAEIDLCGHATLASAFVVLELLDGGRGRDRVTFSSMSGDLTVSREGGDAGDGKLLSMVFPSRPPTPIEHSSPAARNVAEALGAAPQQVLASRDYVAVFPSESDVRRIAPDMRKLSALDRHAVMITAPGDAHDFVSRFFAPQIGVDEDPVTGSAHCTLIPYWKARLGKSRLRALQCSARGGELACEDRGDKVVMAGRAVLYLEGVIHV